MFNEFSFDVSLNCFCLLFRRVSISCLSSSLVLLVFLRTYLVVLVCSLDCLLFSRKGSTTPSQRDNQSGGTQRWRAPPLFHQAET